MKNNVKDPDYGQCVVIPKQVGKKWIWDWSPGSKKNKPEVIEFYNNLECIDINRKINELMAKGYGTIVIKNPGSKHSIGVGILNKLNLIIEGSLCLLYTSDAADE